MELTENWYYFRAPDDIRIDALLEDLRTFCKIEIDSIDDDEGLWITYGAHRIFLSDTICCSNMNGEGRIIDVLRRHNIYLIPYEFNHLNVYALLPSIAATGDALKIDYSTTETKYLNQFQITVKVSDFPDLTNLPDFLFDKFGIHEQFPLRSVQVLPSRVTIRRWHIEEQNSDRTHLMILEYLRGHTDINVGEDH